MHHQRNIKYKCNIEARSRSHCCRGKAISVTYSECVICNPNYVTCNAHALYCHLWPVSLYQIFPNCLLNGKIFGKILLNIKYVSIFSTNLPETSKNEFWFSCKAPVILVRF